MEKFRCYRPETMSLESLEEITNNFSKEQELGRGTYGIVYKGVLQNGEELAVKMLNSVADQDDGEPSFMAELRNLWELRHPNIVRLFGYCYEIRHEILNSCGKLVPVRKIYRALCLEYMQNGSLREHLYEEYHGHDWETRYKIIKGTCEGLKYLHEGLESRMYHLDLKPENILLDENMVPKLADFGLSKLVHHNDRTQPIGSHVGTWGYMPPEFVDNKLLSSKYDIFSLGVVMIRIITGYKGYFKIDKMPFEEFVDHVYENWRRRLHATSVAGTTLEAQCRQVKRCIEIALECIDADREKRPTIGDIVRRLNELQPIIDLSAAPSQLQRISVDEGPSDSSTEIRMRSLGTSELLGVKPLEPCFPFELNKCIECTMNLTNLTNRYVCVWIKPICLEACFSPVQWFLRPRSIWGMHIRMKEQRQPPPQDTCKFEVVMIVLELEEECLDLMKSIGPKLNVNSDLFKRVGQLGGEMYRAMLMGTISNLPSCQSSATHNEKEVSLMT